MSLLPAIRVEVGVWLMVGWRYFSYIIERYGNFCAIKHSHLLAIFVTFKKFSLSPVILSQWPKPPNLSIKIFAIKKFLILLWPNICDVINIWKFVFPFSSDFQKPYKFFLQRADLIWFLPLIQWVPDRLQSRFVPN